LALSASCGGTHTVVIFEGGRIFGCGGNEHRQLGCDTLEDQPMLQELPLPIRAKHVDCGFAHTLLATASGEAWALGGRTSGSPLAPRLLCGSLDGFCSHCTAGGEHSLLRTDSGSTFSFGAGADGQLGWGSLRGIDQEPRVIPGLN
jgi:alpha-tubulin suppressor-like RCC1 family protein